MWRRPNPTLLGNVPLMWQFLEMTVRDWHREAAPYQRNIDTASEEEHVLRCGRAFLELQPYFLKCLFAA
jgi:hypothetical protein